MKSVRLEGRSLKKPYSNEKWNLYVWFIMWISVLFYRRAGLQQTHASPKEHLDHNDSHTTVVCESLRGRWNSFLLHFYAIWGKNVVWPTLSVTLISLQTWTLWTMWSSESWLWEEINAILGHECSESVDVVAREIVWELCKGYYCFKILSLFVEVFETS